MAPLFASDMASFTLDMALLDITTVTSDMASFIFDMVSLLFNGPLQFSTTCVAEIFANTIFKETSSPTYLNLLSCLIHDDRAKRFSNLAIMAIIFGSIFTLMLVCAILYRCASVSTTPERFVLATFPRDLQGNLRSPATVENHDRMYPTPIPSKFEENRAKRSQMGEPLPSIQVLPTACQIEERLMQEWHELLPPHLPYLT